jgi:hypothetical protein
MKYFLHDTSSFDDEKITELFLAFGYEGLGLFYTALEKLAKQEKPIKTEVLKAQLKVGKKLSKCWNFMESIGLISSNNGETFNEQLLNFSEKYAIKKEKNRKLISEWREKQAIAKSVMHYENFCNDDKVKESKINNKLNVKEKEKEFTPPTIDEVKNYISEKGYSIDAEHFVAYYESNGWKVGKNKMKDWKAAIITWSKNDKQRTNNFKPIEKQGYRHPFTTILSDEVTNEQLDRFERNRKNFILSAQNSKDDT